MDRNPYSHDSNFHSSFKLNNQSTEEIHAALPRYEAPRISRKISDISDDSIRQLLKIASLDTEMRDVLDDFDFTEFCDWDLPPYYHHPSFDFQTELESYSQTGIPSSAGISPHEDMYKFDNGLSHIPEESEHELIHNGTTGFEFPQLMCEERDPVYSSKIFHESYPSPVSVQQQSSNFGGFGTEEIQKQQQQQQQQQHQDNNNSVGVRNSQVSLVLGSNVVMLDSRYCPKPAVTVLPSQVIKTPEMTNPIIARSVAVPEQEVTSSTSSKADYWYPGNSSPSSWTPSQNSYMDYGHHHQLDSYFNPQGPGNLGQFQSLGGDPMEADSGLLNDDYGQSSSSSSFLSPMPTSNNKSIKKIAQGDDIIRSLALEASNFLKLDQTTESEICGFVKSVAPQMQNNAWEEVLNETDFEDRLKKAQAKVREHNLELENLKRRIESGEIKRPTGQELIRKTYNRREAAASRAKREEGLMQAAIKKRTLEKICGWMREHLIGNSDLFHESSISHVVRRSLSEGTNSRI
eukprot:g2208.t1